jgi:hypothetical protein
MQFTHQQTPCPPLDASLCDAVVLLVVVPLLGQQRL